MNLQRLKQAEADFLQRHPGGFGNPEMQLVLKKHKMDKMVEMTRQAFREQEFEKPAQIIKNLVKVVSQSSMVSMFEKPKFRSFVNSLNNLERDLLVDGWFERLHGDEQNGFETIVDILQKDRLAKWTLVTICPTYFRPDFDVYVKPTTVKGIIKVLELEQLQYRPAPSWEFYDTFRKSINEMKKTVDPSLSPSNAAFTGFLMSTL
jgi:hypothetical protein